MRKSLILCVVGSILLVGCAGKTQIVKVPVPVPCPAPPAIERPMLPASALTPDSPPDEFVRAVVLSIQMLLGYAEELETALEAYRR